MFIHVYVRGCACVCVCVYVSVAVYVCLCMHDIKVRFPSDTQPKCRSLTLICSVKCWDFTLFAVAPKTAEPGSLYMKMIHGSRDVVQLCASILIKAAA